MEDFYETRISEVDGQMVAFFAVFDGMLKVPVFQPTGFFFIYLFIFGKKVKSSLLSSSVMI